MKYRFVIDKRLMGLNEYTKYNRTNKYAGAGAKKKEQQYIILCIKKSKNRKTSNRTFYMDRREQKT